MKSEPHLGQIVDRLLKQGATRHLTTRSLPAGHLIYGSDEDLDGGSGLLFVRSGRVRCFVSFEGKEMTLFMLEAGDAISLNTGSMLEIKKDAEIVLLAMPAFRQLALLDPELALAAVPLLDRVLQKSIRIIEDMAFHGVKHRLIRALCDTADRDGRRGEHGIVIDTMPNAEDFAMQIGATRQSVSTILAELVRCGIVHRFGAGSMVISDLGRLKQELVSVR
ncbi:Crp/Fnr family transcriptional regulator [Siculibacillus lacustris]|nr:Crp/Fnr family transcriptional regulator [Siculibacillus lacustris]